MPPSLWSRRRIITTLTAMTAVAAVPGSLVLSGAPAYAAEGDAELPGGVPDTARGQVLWAYLTGGRSVRAAAAAALVGSDAQVSAFLSGELAPAKAEDNRVAVFQGLAWAGRSVQAAASRALSGGDEAIAAYLKDGYLAPLKTDLRAEVFRVMESGGAGLRRRANTALDADTQEALETFLLDTRFDGQEEDEQVEVFKILGTASPR